MLGLSRGEGCWSSVRQSASSLREAAGEFSPNLKTAASAITEAIALFGEAELHARRDERAKALKLRQSRGESDDRSAKQLNGRGIATLQQAKSSLDALKRNVQQNAKSAKLQVPEDKLHEFRDGILAGLIDVDIKASDAAEVAEAVDRVIG